MSELKKTITVWKGLVLAVSMVIGSGLLGLPGLTLETGSVYAAAGGWLLISLAMIPLIYIFTSLGLNFTSSAGLSKYAQESVGDWGGHAVSAVLCGTFTIGIPALALIGGAYAQKLFNFPESSVFGLAIAILALMTLGNLMGVKFASLIYTTSFIALVVMVVVIIFSNIPFLNSGFKVFGETITGKGAFNYRDLWRVSALLFWAFLGWENLSFGLEEFKNPKKTIPRVYWLSFLVVVLLYLGLAITSIGAQVSGVTVKGASGLTSLVNKTPIGFLLMIIMVLVILANANAWVFGASRLIYASGRDGILPSFLGRLSKNSIPSASLISLLVVYTVVLLVTHFFKQLSVTTLILLVSQNFIVLYAFSLFAYWKTEKSPHRWLLTLLAIISCIFLLSGFSWWIIYPLILLSVGYISNYRAKVAQLNKSKQV